MFITIRTDGRTGAAEEAPSSCVERAKHLTSEKMQPRRTPQRTSRTHRPLNGSSEPLRIRLLGGFSVSVGSRTIGQGEWHLRKAAILVKLLALSPNHRLQREQMMEALWPDLNPKAASNNLRGALHAARRVLDPDPNAASRYLTLQNDQLMLCPSGQLWVDVESFEHAASTARRNREPAAYRAALDLYAEDLLPEDRYEEWADSRRVALRGLYLTLLADLAELYEQREEYGPAIEALAKSVAKDPTNEEAHTHLMRLYALCGQHQSALAQYERLREVLSTELGTEPGATGRRLREEIEVGGFPSSPPGSPTQGGDPANVAPGIHKHNLPIPRTSFVGRERELIEVRRVLAMTQLLTLTGPGGCGKTRLALEVARDLVGIYPDGIRLVELAPLTEPELVPQGIAGALGVREQPGRSLVDVLEDALRDKELLLVLDNCEHLVDACAPLVDALLASCQHLRVLANGREPLGVGGEVVWRVSSLSVPDADRLPAAGELTRYDAVRLFLDRTHLRLPDFDLTPENGRAVAEVCGRLEGMPLAIELATARMGTLAVEEMAQRLEDSLGLLAAGPRTAPPRQRTMRATLEWSYRLLGEPEQKLFRSLSAFAGGWTFEAAEAVGSDGAEKRDILDLLSGLVDKSLVVAEADGGRVRYRMLELVRQYARERLEESRESDATLHRHAVYFLALAEEAEPMLKHAGQGAWLEQLEREHDNFRAALSWVLEQGETELALRLGAALGEFWHMRGHLNEGRSWLEAALAKRVTPSGARVRVLAKASWIAWEQVDLERAMALGEEGLKLARKLGDEEGAAATLLNLGVAVMLRGELERAAALFQEGLPLFRELGNKGDLARSCLALGCLGLGVVTMLRNDYEQDYERARALFVEGLMVSRESGDVYSSGLALNQLALLPLLRGDYEEADTLCRECLEVSRQSGMMHNIAFALQISASLAGTRRQPVRSASLWGAAEALRETIGTDFSPLERRTFQPYIAAARAQAEDAAWEMAWQEGRAMSTEVAIEYALSKEENAHATTPERQSIEAQATTLTRREGEVAVLVARGLTNRQIAQELSISEHTVATHVGKTMRKLGLSSRSRLAAWTAERLERSSSESDPWRKR